MKGKKRKGADGPKQPNPKQPKPKPKDKPDDLGWVGPVSPQGRALKERLKERAKSRIQFVKCYLKGFIRGRNNVKNKIVAHLRLRMCIHHKQRKLVSLAALVLLAKCLVGPPTPGFHPAPLPPSVQPPPAQGAAPLDPLPGSLAAGPAAGPAQPAWQPKLQERSSSRLASRRPLPPAPVPPQPLNILDPLLAQRVIDWTEEFAKPSELSGWKQIMRGPAHRQNLRPIPKAFFADPDNAAITAKLLELDKTELLGDSNSIGALAKQMAVNTQEMFANPERYVKLWAKAARSKYGITLEVAKLFVRVVCQYGLNYSSPELRDTPLESPEWQERMAYHRHVLTGVLEDVEEAAAPADSEDPDATPAITKLPLHRRMPGKVVTVDEFRTSRVSSILNSPQPCEEELDSSKPTRLQGWKPKPDQVQDRLLRSAWSRRFEAPVRGLMWCPYLAQATPGKLGKWVDRDCNAALNLQRAGESKWRPLELCRWQHRARHPAQGKEYPALGFKKLRERAPKAQAQQPVAQ
ncbi:hypothetical protein QJQ45_007910 [Haematococcus lacustris]|nr:hypothetical protein QJQ45_007910 [Haematococcus lacustris]